MAKVYNGASDFVLFPREQSFFEVFDPQVGDQFGNMQYNLSGNSEMQQDRDFSGRVSTSYEFYPPPSAYSSGASAYLEARNVPFEPQRSGSSLQRRTPSGPSSPTASPIFENPSSSLSSTSGASAQSTASSADGSPYAIPTHSLPYPGKWEPLGLGIGPEIVNTEAFSHHPFQSTNFENDLMLDNGRFAHCVGEYGKNFLSSISTSRLVISSMPSASASQLHLPTLSPSQLTVDTKSVPTDVTIDSILQEAHDQIQKPSHLISPASSTSATTSPTVISNINHEASLIEQRESFKSPVSPASANILYQSPNPRHPYSRLQPPRASKTHSQFHNTQNSFFCQSSGRFVAPLELSCWFS